MCVTVTVTVTRVFIMITYVCVYYCSTYYKAVTVREGGGGEVEEMCYERLRVLHTLGLSRCHHELVCSLSPSLSLSLSPSLPRAMMAHSLRLTFVTVT